MNSHTPSARDIIGSSPLIAIENEAPPKLIVDPPLPEPLTGCYALFVNPARASILSYARQIRYR
jgi:hypothetical protein